MKLGLEQIRTDGGTQPRAELLIEVTEEYAEQMRAGVEFPPITVFFDGKEYWLADGFHRVGAHRRAFGADASIEVEVLQGTQADAQWYSYSVNKTHGLRRNNDDKERAVRAALKHPKSVGLSNCQIAEHCGVDEKTIRKYRRQMGATSEIPKSAETGSGTSQRGQSNPSGRTLATEREPRHRTGRDGRTINTANIGKQTPRSSSSAGGNTLSRNAYKPRLGHSKPCPMIPLTLPLNNPQLAAAALWQEFPASFIKTLVELLSQRLQDPEGEKA